MFADNAGQPLTPLQQAVYLWKQAEAQLTAYQRAISEPIAVIGLGCRFPGGADNPWSYWQLLRDGVDAVREVPAERWNIDDYYDPDPGAPGKMNTRWGGFLDRVDEFDADFFGISPREAIRIDPQQRLLLEVTWEALENAGLPPGGLAGAAAGVYVGVVGSDYALLQSRSMEDMDVFSGTGASHSIIANRLSYVLNLRGPSVTLDTACSSSLVTLHLACQSLRRRESDLALAGGVNLILSPELTMTLTKAHMMAPDGRCKTFDAAANGYVRGEGCGMVVLKRLSDAQATGDRILALIRGTAVNHDGRSNGLSAPSGPAQEAVIRGALADAGLTPTDISYVEAHGTGTRLGDPIEIEALQAALGRDRLPGQPLRIGSVKTNIGHLESAAGIASIIKVILMLQHQQIPPHLHLSTVNPLLRMGELPIEIPTQLQPWQAEGPRRAGVSSFGFGGTNAHAIVEQPPPTEAPAPQQRPWHLVTLSARSPQALGELAGRQADYLAAHPALLGDVAFTSNAGRSHWQHRAAIVADSLERLRDRLQALRGSPEGSGVVVGQAPHESGPRIAFLFTGQGAQYAQMGRGLYDVQPAFRQAMDQCAELLGPELDQPLLSLLEPDAGPLLNQTGYTQPVMFALEYALARLWQSWGIQPAAVMGHSVGEFAAACIAGVFSLADGLRLIAERARRMQALPPGGRMAAVFGSHAQVARAIGSAAAEVAIAAFNGPQSIVISGAAAALERVLKQLESQGLRHTPLTTSHAFHSAQMDPVLEPLERFAAGIACRAPQIPLVANLTGQLADEGTYADPAYWSRHARAPVQFSQGMEVLAGLGCEVFLEIGPSPTLIGMGRRCIVADGRAWLPSLRPGRDDWQTMLSGLAELYVRGAEVDWKIFHDYGPRRIELPTYPFERRRYWAGATAADLRSGSFSVPLAGGASPPLLGSRLVAAVPEQMFQAQLTAHRPALLADHKIQGVVLMPGTGYLEMALAASAAVHGQPWTIRDAALVAPLVLDKTPHLVQTILAAEGPRAATFRIVSVRPGEDGSEPVFQTLAQGRLEAAGGEIPPVDLASVRARFTGEPFDDQWRAEALRKSGLEPGPTFTWIHRHWLDNQAGLAELRAPRESDHAEQYQVHPGLLDCGCQLLGAALPGAGTGIDAYVPVGVECLQFYERPQEASWYTASLTSLTADVATGDVQLVDSQGRVLIAMHGLRLRRVPRDWVARLVSPPPPEWLYHLAWSPQACEPAEPSAAPAEAGRWLIFDSREQLGEAVAQRLELKGHQCRVIPAAVEATPGGAAPHENDSGESGAAEAVDPVATRAAARRAAVAEFLAEPGAWQGVLYLAALDAGCAGEPDWQAARDCGWGGVLDVVQALAVPGHVARPRLWLITRGAEPLGEADGPLALTQAPLWGLGRVIAAEHPELACTRVDLDPRDGLDAADLLAEEICAASAEDQIAYRGDQRWVARLRRFQHRGQGELTLPGGDAHRLEITARGQLDNVALKPILRSQPGRGEVEIEVRATGLNFRDVLNVLDLYPGDPGPLGGECAGVVVAVGEGVQRLVVGQQVVGLAPGSFASHVLTLEEFAVPKPEGVSFEQAATLPICFLSAHLALREVGRLQPDERVLIHAASGGVGLAAIQIAQSIGAEIFATAGSPAKREFLQSLGIAQIMDSRSLGFAEQIREATGGEGVDLVLNSLTGESIGASLSVLRAGGRFVELGKTDLWDQPRVDQFRPGVSFHAIALDALMAAEPERVGKLLRELLPEFVDGRLQPLRLRSFPITRVVDALRHMARAEHIGKVVITAAAGAEAAQRSRWLQEDGTYLITGGLGGLGLKLARWLANRGARQLVLVGRSPASDEAQAEIGELRQAGVAVDVRRCDISRSEQVAAMLDRIDRQLPPLRGVFHLAGVLDDGLLRDQNRLRFDRVMAAKVAGAWNLHQLTRERPLDLFVLFSSAAALLGSPGQGNYAAANAFLDALAHQRRREGLPALSINWGSWAEVGMAARLKDAEGRRWSAAGVGWIEPQQGLETLEQLIVQDRVQAGVLPIDWAKFFERIPRGSEPPWLQEMAAEAGADSEGEAGGTPLLERLQECTPVERLEVAIEGIREQAARVLAMDDGQLPDPRRPLNELGFDSLTAVEFCNRVGRSVGQTVNPTLLFDYPTLAALAGYVVSELLQLETAAGADQEEERAREAEQAEAAQQVEEMSDAEMDALVMAQLERLQVGANAGQTLGGDPVPHPDSGQLSR